MYGNKNQILAQYLQRLSNNPAYQYSTVERYYKAIDELIEKYKENPNIEQLNNFITIKSKKHQPYVKYAIKEYLNLIGRQNDYLSLVKAKCREPVRQKVFLSIEQLSTIINTIKAGKHKAIALLQFYTAQRASEVIKIRKRNITFEDNRIRIRTVGKGDKPHNVFLLKKIWEHIDPYYKENPLYLFLNIQDTDITEEELHKKTYSLYKRYDESLKSAAWKCYQIKISSHDIRRSVANLITLQNQNNPRAAQKVLNHNSVNTTEIYLQDDTEKISETMLKFQKILP